MRRGRWLIAAPVILVALFDYAENGAVAAMLAAGAAGLTPDLVERASRWTLLKSTVTTVAILALLGLLVWQAIGWMRRRRP